MPSRIPAPKQLPPRAGLGSIIDGHYLALVDGSETTRPGVGVFSAAAWSWGTVGEGTFLSGIVPVRLAGYEPIKGDKFGKSRAPAKYIYGWDGKSLSHVQNYSVIPEKIRKILEENDDVFVESNLAIKDTPNTVGQDLQIIPLVPDHAGNYDLAVARAHVDPPGRGQQQTPQSREPPESAGADTDVDPTTPRFNPGAAPKTCAPPGRT